jgi:hypothetical protein
MPGVIAIVAYRPHPGKDAALAALLAEHLPTLRAAGLATERATVLAKAKDGTLIEVFEWASEKAIELAHADEAVRALWERFDEVCDYVPVGELAEAAEPFSAFAAVEALP